MMPLSLQERTRNELKKDVHWTRKAVVINIYHNYKCNSSARWTYADTGRDLDVSKSYISECIALAKILDKHPDMIHMSRIKALSYMRGN
jgi:hypothetical protein